VRRFAIRAAAVVAAALVLTACASGDEEPAQPQGPNGYTLSADLEDGYALWWDRSPESGLTDLIATGPEGRIIGSCLGMPGEICFIGPQEGRMGLVIAEPAAASGVIHFFGQDVPLVVGTGPAEDDPAVLAVRLPQDRPDPEAGWSIELADASGQPVPLQ